MDLPILPVKMTEAEMLKIIKIPKKPVAKVVMKNPKKRGRAWARDSTDPRYIAKMNSGKKAAKAITMKRYEKFVQSRKDQEKVAAPQASNDKHNSPPSVQSQFPQSE